jgi:hypothetical protein
MNQIMGLDASQLMGYAKKQLEIININAKAQVQGQQNRPPQPAGSQTNPIEIATPVQSTPQLPNPANLPPNAFQTPQTSTSQMPNQGIQPTPPDQGMRAAGPVQPRARPWDGMDFTKEPFPLNPTQFWEYLGNMSAKKGETLVPPVIEGKGVDLHKLFSLVHRNGGCVKVS